MHDSKNINYTIRQDCVYCYGKEFSFTPGDHTKKAEAENAAKSYGGQLLNALEAKANRKLTSRERLSGKLEPRTDHRPLARQMANEAFIQSQPEPSSDNPHLSRLAELESRDLPISAGERAQLRRRIQQTKKSVTEWDAEKARTDAIAARNADPSVKFMREHSDLALRRTLLDRNSSSQELIERQALADRVREDSIEPQDYTRLSDELDGRWFARLDAEAANKKAEADQFAAAVAESKEFAAILGDANG